MPLYGVPVENQTAKGSCINAGNDAGPAFCRLSRLKMWAMIGRSRVSRPQVKQGRLPTISEGQHYLFWA